MDTLNAIAKRHSTREFSDKQIPTETLEAIVNAGRVAPTARNEQPWEFLVLTEPEALKHIGGLTDHGPFIAEAVACVAVFCRDGKYYLEDGCAATENMLIAATDLDVQSCWVAGDKKPYCQSVIEYLGVPEGYKLVSLIALGFEAGHAKTKSRRDLKEMLHWERW